jgi:hypothetical protein
MNGARAWRDPDIMNELYVEQDLSINEVAEQVGCSATTVMDWLHRLGVGGIECPFCGKSYERLGRHWTENPQHHPSFNEKHHAVTTGVLMGDGSISRDSDNPRLVVKMTNKEYLEYLSNIFGILSLDVKLDKTASEAARRSKERGFSDVACENNYSDLYSLQTRRSVKFKPYTEWYDGGDKIWPKDIELSPTVLKHWYVCDGSLQKRDSEHGFRMTIALSNERGNRRKVEQMFERANIPVPCNWDERKRDSGRWDVNIYWRNEQTRELIEYMGTPLPGFEYKWPKEEYQ